MTAMKHPLPAEYKRQIPAGPLFNQVNTVLEDEKLNTICVSGKCPNRGECFSRGSLAFMILGDICTRHCGFCAVKAGTPGEVDTAEPERLARAAANLNLKHVVITSVARDDLKDGGASIFADCIRELRRQLPSAISEVLTPDFNGDTDSLDVVLDARPDIYNHNIETVERLTPKVRSRANYRRSLEVLRYAKEKSKPHPLPLSRWERGESNPLPSGEGGRRPGEAMKTKSGLMLGLGETRDEILQTLKDLRSAGCDYLTIGQYLQPSAGHLSIQYFVPVEDFQFWKEIAFDLGFERVASGPLVRSSYFADQLHEPVLR
jgi:lipoyl synthase